MTKLKKNLSSDIKEILEGITGKTKKFKEILKLKYFDEIDDELLRREVSFIMDFIAYIEKTEELKKRATPKGYKEFLETLNRNIAIIRAGRDKSIFFKKTNNKAVKINNRYVLTFDGDKEEPTFSQEHNAFVKRSRVRVGDIVYLNKEFAAWPKGQEGFVLQEYHKRLGQLIAFQLEFDVMVGGKIVDVDFVNVPIDALVTENRKPAARTKEEEILERGDYTLMGESNPYEEFIIDAESDLLNNPDKPKNASVRAWLTVKDEIEKSPVKAIVKKIGIRLKDILRDKGKGKVEEE